jgi:GDPmannose 4,6-dehydratase
MELVTKKRCLIFGISGMDGSNLADYLLSLGHEVHGLVRRHSVAENQAYRLVNVKDKITTHYGDITDPYSVDEVVRNSKPDYIFHLAAMSHVKISFDMPAFVMQTNFVGTLNILEAYRKHAPDAHFYFAGSSECFGLSIDPDKHQRESTPFNPTSPYGISKVASVNLVRHYRRTYGLFACVGILFNHSGFRRGSNFVCQKIVKSAVEIKLGKREELKLGNLDSFRDIGNSKDYIRAMWLIVNHVKADDFVVATGKTHSIREMCDYVFKKLDLDYMDYVKIDPKLFRPEELPFLCGDSTRARIILGWEPEYSFEDTIQEMIDHWYTILR